MDHRCLYGHRVPISFTFAIQNRVCPTCGANTVTLNGYQAARRLTQDAQIDAVVAFNAVRILESEWVLTPISGAAEDDEVAVVDETPEPPPAAQPPPPEPKIRAVTRTTKTVDKPAEKTADKAPAPGADGADVVAGLPADFATEEDDFFKQA